MTARDPTARPSRVVRRTSLLWLVAYLIVISGLVVAMLQIRRTTLRTLDTPAAQAEWNAWREAPPNVRTDLPVRRHPPSSDEPPALILMRDYFPVMMAAAVVFGSLLFAAIMIAARGALWRDHDRPSSPDIGDG